MERQITKGYKRKGNNFRKNEIIVGVDPHHFQRIDLFGNTHSANTRGDVRANFSSHNDRNKSGCKF